MIDLRALGGLDLRHRDGPELRSVLAQPRRTALLAYLALARPQGFHRRDTLIALFWPEHDTEHARNNLRQAVHFLRRSLGEEAIAARGDDEIRLAEGTLSCDAVQFDAALDAGELQRGVGLYAGDLLPGFFVEAAPEFERWLEGERTRLRERAVRACWSLADAREAAGDTATAAEWGRRALALAPADDTQIMRLMQLLACAGDRSGALAAFETYASRLRLELEVEPTEAAKALAEEIRKTEPARPGRGEAPARRVTTAAEGALAPRALEPGAAPPLPDAPSTPLGVTSPVAQAAAAAPAGSEGGHERSRGYGRNPGLWLAGLAGILIGIPVALLAVGLGHALKPGAVPLVGAGVLFAAAGLVLVEAAMLVLWVRRRRDARARGRPSGRVGAGLGFALGVPVALSIAFTLAPHSPRAAPSSPRRPISEADTVKVTVTHFANLTGDPTLAPVGRMAEDWVVRRLRAIPEAEVVAIAPTGVADTSLDAVTALAHRTGADLVLFGSYYRDGNDVLLAARLVPPRGGRIPPQIARVQIGPVRTPRNRPVAAVDRLGSLVAGAVAGKCLFPGCGVGRRAPMYEARQLFLEAAQARERGDAESARQKFRQAIAVDSMFGSAYTHLAAMSTCTQKDSIGEILEARRQDFRLDDLVYIRIHRAVCHGDFETIYRLKRQELERAPENNYYRAGLAVAAAFSGRLREAERLWREVIARADSVSDAGPYRSLAEVLHYEGKIAEELQVAAQARRLEVRNPERSLWVGLPGLAALGRTQELEARIDEIRRAGQDRFVVVRAYFTVTNELEWHGHVEAARQFALATSRELDRLAPADRRHMMYMLTRSEMLLRLGRWAEARRLVDTGDPRNRYLVMARGLAAAGAGDVPAARAALAALDQLPDSAFDGEMTRAAPPIKREESQAAVLAALGEKDEALRRLEDGQLRGTVARSGVNHAYSWHLHPLWHDARFERMFAPRD